MVQCSMLIVLKLRILLINALPTGTPQLNAVNQDLVIKRKYLDLLPLDLFPLDLLDLLPLDLLDLLPLDLLDLLPQIGVLLAVCGQTSQRICVGIPLDVKEIPELYVQTSTNVHP